MSHFVEAPLNVDLREDFTILAWAFCRDRSQWRSIISFESPQVSTSLLTLTLPPSHKPSIPHVAYMTGARPSDFGTLQGQMEVPMNVWFHVAAVFKAGVVTSTLELYVNGEEGGSMRVEDRWIFNAKDISVVLGSSTINNNPAWQWSGSMTDVYVYQASMTKEQIAGLMAEGSLPRVRSVPLGLAQFDASPETSEGMSPPGAITPSLWQSNPTPFIFSGGVSK
ncbi:hypothetical protein BV22DRAFT_411788 [Leucogyrophana mollusca]|uniref:Uncharacterized protein n=1 Tax=Leucogyrophana mollusca TaxID=85980 RepID=A0ACB8BLJ1_9AGAM|nr:hypothetical protein BV22DRAFT_411788 [Leucogyrophana mollusca]